MLIVIGWQPSFKKNLQVSTKQQSEQRILSQDVNVEVYKPRQIHTNIRVRRRDGRDHLSKGS
ncbi:hypothetical protein BRADI_2g03454v3 [Brachypodium distachyon]|uniref:Uncharacterized protein n=1 Tax=Brachypodium distachyon TaxID=15368 RepID=A0A2K2D6P1_BRADI|nr:hypothetical protein BRADI_2g03454v3 [Brachypodium distachyon]